MTDPPQLSHGFNDSVPVIAIGTVGWAVLAGVGLVVSGVGELFWTGLAGVGVGLFGASVFAWQRAAARRGSRLAQAGVDG